MKPTVKKVARRVVTIDTNSEAASLSMKITNHYVDDSEDVFTQDFNLSVMPYDMAMSVICSLINPVERKRQ